MISTGEKKFTRHHLALIGIFVSILIVLEILIGSVFISVTTGRIENERRNEFYKSWEKFLEQRRQLHESKLTGYAWWDELAAAVSAGNMGFIQDNFFTDKSLRREYDTIMLVSGNFFQTLVSVDGKDSVNAPGDFSKQETGMMREFLNIINTKWREIAEARTPLVIENPISWHFLTKLKGETRLLTLSPICDNSGRPAAAGYIILGFRLDKIVALAEQIIPAKIKVSDTLPDKAYGFSEIHGFWPDEKYFIEYRPNILIADIAKFSLMIFIIIQVVLSVIVLASISPSFTKKYTQELQEIIDEKTEQLHTANMRLEDRTVKMLKNLEMAKRVQESIVKNIPEINELDVEAHYLCMEMIGGDVYDIRRIGRFSYSFMIADVSGHGIPSALITTMTKTSFINHAHFSKTTDVICSKVNRDLFDLIGSMDYYLTAFFALLDIESLELRYTNCGHQNPILYRHRNGEIQELTVEKGVPIGIMQSPEFETRIINLEFNDKLFLYTDGITEARNVNGDFYTVERLLSFIRNNGALHPRVLLEKLIAEIDAFCGLRAPDDDRAIVLIEVLKNVSEEEEGKMKVAAYTV